MGVAMTEEQYNLACLELALQTNNPRENLKDRVDTFSAFVAKDEIRLGCLRVAIKTFGKNARIQADRLIDEAATFLSIVSVVPAKEDPPKRRGRPKKES